MPDSNNILLKKYSNRRLYDTEKSVYVTLEDVAAMIQHGRWVTVKDADTGEDMTAFTLTQIIMEEAKKKNALLPSSLLHLVIRYGENLLSDFFNKHLEKMIASYISYKIIADEQFNRWLEMGAGMPDMTRANTPENNPLQSFFKQFFPDPPSSDGTAKRAEPATGKRKKEPDSSDG